MKNETNLSSVPLYFSIIDRFNLRICFIDRSEACLASGAGSSDDVFEEMVTKDLEDIETIAGQIRSC